MITGGNINDPTLMTAVLEDIRVPAPGRVGPAPAPTESWPTRGTRPEPTEPGFANEASRRRSLSGTTRSRTRRKKPGRPIDFGDQQQERYKGRNVVERCFNRLKQWRGIAMRSDKLLRSYRAAVSLAATLIWITSDLINTA